MTKKNLKLRVLTATLALLLCMSLAGCGNDSDRDIVIGNNDASTSSESENSGKTYTFVYNNVKINTNDLVDPLISALGSDYTYRESASCAYTGMDKFYIYKGFSIYTYPDDDAVDHVLQIVLTDDSLSTPEGLTLGDPTSKVTELYGEADKKSDSSYLYTDGTTNLVITFTDDCVSSIQYIYVDAL